MEASGGGYTQPGPLFPSVILYKERQKDKELGESLGQLEEAQDQRPRKHDLRGVIEWPGVNWSKVERLGKSLVNSL